MSETVTLKNGARIVLEQMTQVRSVSLGIWVLAGSRNETARNNGISHFIEHMLFKGTKTRSAFDIADEMDNIGGQMNAYTTKELTCFYARVLDEHFDTALDVLSDMLFNSNFDGEETEREKNVILEEISMYEDTPEDLVHDLMQYAVWQGDPLGFSVLGVKDTVVGINPSDFRSYMRRNYRPENIVISVSGNFDYKETVRKIEERFSVFDVDSDYVKPEYNVSYNTTLIKKEKDVEQLHICLTFPGIPLGSNENYTMAALNTILGGGMSSRLFQNIREKRGLVYSIYSFNVSCIGAGLFGVYAALNPGSAEPAVKLIKEEIANLFSDRITETQLQKTKEQIKSNYLLGLESTSNRMSAIGRSELMLNRVLSESEIIDKINDVSAERIYALAESLFDFKKMSMSAVGKVGKLNFDKIYG